jgi:hypothetical protein
MARIRVSGRRPWSTGWGSSATAGWKKGAFLHRRLVEVGQRGVSVRQLGGGRAGEMRLTRFLRNPKVTPQAIFAEAAARTGEQVRGLHVLTIQDTTALTPRAPAGSARHSPRR